MRRREFIALISATAAAVAPLLARAQLGSRQIAIWMGRPNDPRGGASLTKRLHGLRAAFAGLGILHLAKLVTDELSDVGLIVEALAQQRKLSADRFFDEPLHVPAPR